LTVSHEREATLSASSRHGSGFHGLMVDGSVKFITESIDTGNAQKNTPQSIMVILGAPGSAAEGSPSPHGLWGSLGTRAASEGNSADF